MPAKQTTRWMAPALPVFAGKPAPTGITTNLKLAQYLWERVHPRRGQTSQHIS